MPGAALIDVKSLMFRWPSADLPCLVIESLQVSAGERVFLFGPTVQARPVTELSVGQQQRVAVARALIGRPELIIADEPTSSLDADAQQAFLELLLHECDRWATTLLFVSHNRQLASYFDREVN